MVPKVGDGTLQKGYKTAKTKTRKFDEAYLAL